MLKIVEPKVYLVSSPFAHVEDFCEFVADEGLDNIPTDFAEDGQWLCEQAGRLCYMSYGKGRKTNKEFLDHIIEVGHESVLEHANYGFIITGVSRSFTHELVRHRHLSFSQLSQRYVDETEAGFICPPPIASSADMRGTFDRAIKVAQTAYSILVSTLELLYRDEPNVTTRRKLARQAARSVLPNATETKIFVTGNARAWRHFIKLRTSPHADVEIRQVAYMILEKLSTEAPNLFEDLNASIATTQDT